MRNAIGRVNGQKSCMVQNCAFYIMYCIFVKIPVFYMNQAISKTKTAPSRNS